MNIDYSLVLFYGSLHLPKHEVLETKWPDKSTTSYDMLDFKSKTKIWQGKYLLIERHIFQIQGILLQHLKLD